MASPGTSRLREGLQRSQAQSGAKRSARNTVPWPWPRRRLILQRERGKEGPSLDCPEAQGEWHTWDKQAFHCSGAEGGERRGRAQAQEENVRQWTVSVFYVKTLSALKKRFEE